MWFLGYFRRVEVGKTGPTVEAKRPYTRVGRGSSSSARGQHLVEFRFGFPIGNPPRTVEKTPYFGRSRPRWYRWPRRRLALNIASFRRYYGGIVARTSRPHPRCCVCVVETITHVHAYTRALYVYFVAIPDGLVGSLGGVAASVAYVL